MKNPYFEQLSLFDLYPDILPKPEMYECMKTCVHANEYLWLTPSGFTRCDYAAHLVGTSGLDVEQVIRNNYVLFYCKFYKRNV